MNDYNSNLVKCFSNSVLGVNLTTILIDMEPWFIAKEVATLLGYENTSRSVNDHVDELDQKMLSHSECKELFGNILDSETIENTDDYRGTISVPRDNAMKINSNGMKFINESGLYTLIARSNKPEARKFQRWVTSEVLPSIRKTGSYGLQITKEDRLKLNVLNATDPDTRFKALSELEQLHAEQKKALEYKNEQLEADNETLTEQRDKAIATKAQISTNREAVALGRVGGLVNAINKLKDTIFGNREYRTIRAIAALNHLKDKDINWRKLKAYCVENHLEIREVADEKFGSIKSYPIEAFKAIYPQLMIN